MANFYTDNKALQYHLNHPLMKRIVALKERNFVDCEKYDYAPIDFEDAMDSYRKVLEIAGELAAEVIAPNAESVDAEGPHVIDGHVKYAEGTQKNLDAINQAGMMGISLPRRYNGLNFSIVPYIMANDMMVKELEQVVVRFSGDSGDGMQLAGNIFSTVSATVGNDISTFPDYPADIRAPQGSLTGVSGFQVHIGAGKVYTPGDQCDVLVAMNAAALKTQYKFAKKTACIIIDTDAFQKADLDKAQFKTDDPIEERCDCGAYLADGEGLSG